ARKRGRFRCCYGGVERKRALLARLRDQALSAIGARIRIDRGGLLGLREGRRRPETHEGATCEKRTNRALWRAAPHAPHVRARLRLLFHGRLLLAHVRQDWNQREPRLWQPLLEPCDYV